MVFWRCSRNAEFSRKGIRLSVKLIPFIYCPHGVHEVTWIEGRQDRKGKGGNDLTGMDRAHERDGLLS